MTENVIYTYEGEYRPPWQYYSTPHSCVGGGDTIDDARASYREALASLLQVDPTDLPPIVEHIEVEATDGVFVRYPARDPLRANGAQLVTQLLRDPSFFDPRLEKALRLAPTAGGYPVLVITELHDPINLALDQMTAHDSLWLAFPLPMVPRGLKGMVGLISLAGEQSEDVDAISVELDEPTLMGMTVQGLVERYGLPRADRTTSVPPRVRIAATV
ncbi:hypothetical protein [Mycobacterium marinum]|uniref:hypothetical protein n=1 Tax=Mycobacterium marinum TaxID=1781 RepID=UPI00235923CC|nr:hypothetical protein [Mycobacterium marinum]MDC8974654.1 hypothetical protein [Mycobacterium marinum]